MKAFKVLPAYASDIPDSFEFNQGCAYYHCEGALPSCNLATHYIASKGKAFYLCREHFLALFLQMGEYLDK